VSILLAWIWAPLLGYVLALGTGLLVDVGLRVRLPPALIPPIGLAVAIVLITPGYRLGVSAWLGIALLVTAAAAGFVLARRGLWERIWAPAPLVAAGMVYLLYMAPVLLSGDATWAGYNFVNDTASNFILADLLERTGAQVPGDVTGAANNARNLVESGYPLGSFSLMATIRPLTGAPLEAVYQPLVSLFAAFAAMSFTEIGRRAGMSVRAALLAAVLAMGGVLAYRYALHGAIKEVMMVALCAAAAAVAAVAVERRLPIRLVAVVAVVCLAMVLVFSAAAGAFALALGIAMLVAAAASPERPSLRHLSHLAGLAAAMAVVVLAPTLGTTLDFVSTVRGVFAAQGGVSTGMLGQLLRPLPASEVAGIWVSGDYRLPAKSPLGVNSVLVAIAVGAALGGVVVGVRRRLVAPLLALATVGLPALALAPAVSPYIDAKLMMVASPTVVLVASIATVIAMRSTRRTLKAIGGLGLAAVVVGVLASDFYSYRETQLAPLDRMAAMEDVAAHVPDRRLYLFNEWEEFGKYFLRSARVNPASEAESQYPVKLRTTRPIFGRWFDLDRQKLGYVQRFAGIIVRRSPAASRPPASFQMLYRNKYYELWRRDPEATVRTHLPLVGLDRRADSPSCPAVRRLADRARPGDFLVAAGGRDVVHLSPFVASGPSAWKGSPDRPGMVSPRGPGAISGTITAGGRRDVWLKLSGGRGLTVSIDGRPVGNVRQFNTPDQWLEVGSVRLAPGSHRVEVRRGGAGWQPGDAEYGVIGPLALERPGRAPLVRVTPPNAERLCGKRWDWIELVGGRR
jgi:hypothetical protein